jgi:uncharacterized protein YuzE
MVKRGKVIRDTNLGPGLLAIGGSQYPFTLEGIWKSETAPKPNMAVEVDFHEDGSIAAIRAVNESQLAKEQADKAIEVAKESGARLASTLVATFGIEVLVATATLVVGWFFLNMINVQVMEGMKTGATFWQALSILNSPMGILAALGGTAGSTGAYGFFAIAALLGPFLHFVWKDPRAHLGGALPLLFMLLIGLMIYMGISDSVKQSQAAAGAFGGREVQQFAAKMAAEMTKEAMKAISIGLGAYLSAAASLYLAAKGGMKYLAAKANS